MKHARLFGFGLGLLALLGAGCGTAPTMGHFAPALTRHPVAIRPMAANALDAYYAPAEGKDGQALLQALKGIVSNHKDLGYGGAREVMFATIDDLDGDDVVECIYTGREMERVTGKDSAYHGGTGLNAEHTWPQSKGAQGAAKADLHHLFPADCKANGVRGNLPFGMVKASDWAEGGSRRGVNAEGETVFEPRDEQKGDTARALLYFFTVYGQAGSTQMVNFRIEEPVLKAWSKADPVTPQERARNEAIFKVQGNRNPFVDHPEYVERVGTFLSRFQGLKFAL